MVLQDGQEQAEPHLQEEPQQEFGLEEPDEVEVEGVEFGPHIVL